MKKIFIILFVTIISLSSTFSAHAAVLTFENISNADLINYEGVTFKSFCVMERDYELSPIASPWDRGRYYGAVSGTHFAYGNKSSKIISYGNNSFNFIGAYITAESRNDVTIVVNGYNNGSIVYSKSIALSQMPTLVNFNYMNVDKVVIDNIIIANYKPGQWGGNFLLDNAVITFGGNTIPPVPTPEPSTFILGLMGGSGLFIKRKKLSKIL